MPCQPILNKPHWHVLFDGSAWSANGLSRERTCFCGQVVCGLFALKVLSPSRVFLVRGNHEFQDVSEGMDDGASGHGSFRQAVQRRLPAEWQSVYTAVFQAFEMLPLAAMLENKILVLHGGLGAAYRIPVIT